LPLCLILHQFTSAQQQPGTAVNQQDEVVTLDVAALGAPGAFKILRSGDKQEINRYVTKVYPLAHANPYELLPYLRTIAALEKGNVVTAWVPKPGEKALSWIQVNVPDFQIPSIDEAVKAYDVPDFASIPGDIKFSYRTKYRSAVEIADFIRVSTLSPDGLIKGDPTTNTIYVQDSPSDFLRVFAQIQFYDIPAPQIDLEVSIIELAEVDQTSLGLDWDAWKTALGGAANLASTSAHVEPAVGPDLNSNSRTFEGLLSIDATAAARFLNYLVDRGKARVRTRTNLTVTTGTAASIASGIGVPSYSYTYEPTRQRSILTKVPGTANSEGFSVTIVPTIAMKAARMEVALALRSPVAIDKTGTPVYSDQEVLAEMTLEQNQLLRVGGVRRGVETVQRKGFPLLKDIPLIKYLFSNETRLIRESELYVFIRPTWTAPLLPDVDSMKIDKSFNAQPISDLLRNNPELSISGEDAALLERYFGSLEQARH
jgi:type II secretory pathway component GspD/PulD (secretin)